MLKLGSVFPSFTVTTTNGKVNIPECFDKSWSIIFTHPADFTPVCTTEFARTVQLVPEFTKRNVQIIGISCDTIDNHSSWEKDILHVAGVKGGKFPFPIIADIDRELVTTLGMLDPSERNSAGLPLPARAVYILDPNKVIRAGLLYPASAGRNFDEILRLVDSLQLTSRTGAVTPVNWNVGDAVIVPPSMTTEDARDKYKAEVDTFAVPSGKNYLRYTHV